MKKWYKESYFDSRTWLLENFDKLNLSSDELIILQLIDLYGHQKEGVSYERIRQKFPDKEAFDSLFSGLVNKGYLRIDVDDDSGIRYDISAVFEFDINEYDAVENTDIYSMCENLLHRPLNVPEIQKVSELIEKYDHDEIVQAIRIADSYRKSSIAYIEGVLRNGKTL